MLTRFSMQWCLVALLSHCLTAHALNFTRNRLFHITENHRYKSLVTETSVSASGASDCSIACLTNVKCENANYNSLTRMCSMGYLRCNDDSMGQDTDCTTISKKLYAPFLCKSPWIYHGDSCYLIETDTTKWSRARDQCQQLGGDLVVIDSYQEAIFLRRLYECIELQSEVWIGGHLPSENWVWVTGGIIPNNDWWNGYTTERYKCLTADLFPSHLGKLRDLHCDFYRPYICEK